MAGAGCGGGVSACLDRVLAARAQSQSGLARSVRIQPAAVAGAAAQDHARASRDGPAGGGPVAESRAVADAERLELLAFRASGREGGDGDGLRDGDERRATRPADGGLAGFRGASGLRRQGDREPFDGADEPGNGQDLGPGRGLGQARDARRRQEDGPGLDQGEDLVRLRSAPDRRHAIRDSGGLRGDAGVGLGVGSATVCT